MIRRYSIAFLVFVIMAPYLNAQEVLPGAADKDPLVVGCEDDYPPYCMITERGQADGFSVELFRVAAENMNLEVRFVPGEWRDLKEALAKGEIDALPLVGRTPEREPVFDFTSSYLTMHGTLVLREDETGIRSLEDLADKRVLVMKGDNAEEFLRRKDVAGTILTTGTFREALLKLSRGEGDAVFIQKMVALQLIQKLNLSNLKTLGSIIPDFDQSFCFAVKEGNHELLDQLNEGLSLAIADGSLRRLHAKWFAPIEYSEFQNRRILVGGDANYPPFEFINENGDPDGFNVEITRAIAEEMGIDVEIRLQPWTKTLEDLQQKRIDALQGMYYSVERDMLYDLTPYHTQVSQVFVASKGKPLPSSLSELDPEDTLVLQRGDIMHDYVRKMGYEGPLLLTPSQEEALMALRTNRADYMLGARPAAFYWKDKNGWDDLQVGDQIIRVFEYCYAVAEDNQSMLSLLSDGLTAIKNSGEYRRIYNKWLGVHEDTVPWDKVMRYSLFIAIPLLLLLILSITWTRTLRNRVNQKTRDLQEANAAKDRFFSLIGHDLRSPISTIQGFSKLLYARHKTLEPEKTESYVQSIYHSSEQAFALLDNLLLWAQSQSGRIEFNPVETDFSDLARESIEMIQDQAMKKNIAIRQQFDQTGAVMVDKNMVSTILRNLLSNAIKYSRPGTAVQLQASRDKKNLVIKVSDQGVGMSNKEAKNLFRIEQGTSRPGTANEKGTGLGLLLCKDFAEQHKGSIEVDSQPDKGTTFTVTLPQ